MANIKLHEHLPQVEELGSKADLQKIQYDELTKECNQLQAMVDYEAQDIRAEYETQISRSEIANVAGPQDAMRLVEGASVHPPNSGASSF